MFAWRLRLCWLANTATARAGLPNASLARVGRFALSGGWGLTALLTALLSLWVCWAGVWSGFALGLLGSGLLGLVCSGSRGWGLLAGLLWVGAVGWV